MGNLIYANADPSLPHHCWCIAACGIHSFPETQLGYQGANVRYGNKGNSATCFILMMPALLFICLPKLHPEHSFGHIIVSYQRYRYIYPINLLPKYFCKDTMCVSNVNRKKFRNKNQRLPFFSCGQVVLSVKNKLAHLWGDLLRSVPHIKNGVKIN